MEVKIYFKIYLLDICTLVDTGPLQAAPCAFKWLNCLNSLCVVFSQRSSSYSLNLSLVEFVSSFPVCFSLQPFRHPLSLLLCPFFRHRCDTSCAKHTSCIYQADGVHSLHVICDVSLLIATTQVETDPAFCCI